MARKQSPVLTDGEHRIMEILWQKGAATVAEVAEALEGEDGAAYTTILTMMRIMRDKGYLRTRKEGRALVFIPKFDRDDAARKAVHQVLGKFFAGSPNELVLSFLRDEEITLKEIDELRRKIVEQEKEKKDER